VSYELDRQSLRKAIDSGAITGRSWYHLRQDGSSSTSFSLGINRFPTILIVDGGGVIRYRDAGVDRDRPNEPVDALLKVREKSAQP
jgi:hypothetical protein